MIVNSKYLKNGWTSYNEGTEYEYSTGELRLKNEWWK